MSRLEAIPEIDMSNQCNLPILYNNSLTNLQSEFLRFAPKRPWGLSGALWWVPSILSKSSRKNVHSKTKEGGPQNKGYENSSKDDVSDETLIEKRYN